MNQEEVDQFREERERNDQQMDKSHPLVQGRSQGRVTASISPATQSRQLFHDQFKILDVLKEQQNGTQLSVFNRSKESLQNSNIADSSMVNVCEDTQGVDELCTMERDNNFNNTAENYKRDGTKFSTPNGRLHLFANMTNQMASSRGELCQDGRSKLPIPNADAVAQAANAGPVPELAGCIEDGQIEEEQPSRAHAALYNVFLSDNSKSHFDREKENGAQIAIDQTNSNVLRPSESVGLVDGRRLGEVAKMELKELHLEKENVDERRHNVLGGIMAGGMHSTMSQSLQNIQVHDRDGGHPDVQLDHKAKHAPHNYVIGLGQHLDQPDQALQIQSSLNLFQQKVESPVRAEAPIDEDVNHKKINLQNINKNIMQKSSLIKPNDVMNLSARYAPSPKQQDLHFLSNENAKLEAKEQTSATAGRSGYNHKKDSLFRNSLDEYSAHVHLKPSKAASGNSYKQDSEMSVAFENTKGNQSLNKKDRCSESNQSYDPILNTQNLSAMAPQMRSSRSLRRQSRVGAEYDERDSLPNVNQSITESDSGWILGGAQGGAARHEIVKYGSQHRQQNNVQKDQLYHSKSVNLHAKESAQWQTKGPGINSFLGANNTLKNQGGNIGLMQTENCEVRSVVGVGPSTHSNNLLDSRPRDCLQASTKEVAMGSNSISNFDQLESRPQQSLTPNHNHNMKQQMGQNQYTSQMNFACNVSGQFSALGRRKSSASPIRSAMGQGGGTQSVLGNNKDMVDQVLQDRCNQSLEELHRVKKEYRAKEQEYEKKIALMKQEIELLQLQVKETESREEQQRKMYERMFQALDVGIGAGPSANDAYASRALENQGSAARGGTARDGTKRGATEDVFNSTQMSFGKEIEQIQKQFHEEMQSRITELEAQLKQKEQDFELLREKNNKYMAELLSDNKSLKAQSQQASISLNNSQRQLKEKELLIDSQQEMIRSLTTECEQLKSQHNVEIESLEKDMHAKYLELKSLYKKSSAKEEKNPRESQTSSELPSDVDAYLNKIRALEEKIEVGKKIMSSSERNQERLGAENSKLQEQVSLFEKKVKSKKEKIKGLTSEYGEKSKECEAFRQKVVELEKQLIIVQQQSQGASKPGELTIQLQAEIEQLKNKETKNKSVQVSLLQSHSTIQTSSRELDAEKSNLICELSAQDETYHQQEPRYAALNFSNCDQKQNEGTGDIDLADPHQDQSVEALTRKRASEETEIANSMPDAAQSINKIINRAKEDDLVDETKQIFVSANDYEQVIEKQTKLHQQNHRNDCLSLRQSSNNQHFSGHFFNSNQLIQISEQECNDVGLHENEENDQNQELVGISQEQEENFDGAAQLQQNTFASNNNSMLPNEEQLLPPQERQAYPHMPECMPDLANPSGSAADYAQNLFNNGQRMTIEFEELQLFERLKKIVDCSVKMQCIGCHKLVPTVQFYDHLREQVDDEQQAVCEGEAEYRQLHQQLTMNQRSFAEMDRSRSAGRVDRNAYLTLHRQRSQAQSRSRGRLQPKVCKLDSMIVPGFSRNEIHHIKRSKSENAVREQRALNSLSSQNQLFTTCHQNQLLEQGHYGQSYNEMFDHQHCQINMPSINNFTDQELKSQIARSSHSNKRSGSGLMNQMQVEEGKHVDYRRMYQNALNLIKKQQAQLSLLLLKLRQQQELNERHLDQHDHSQKQSHLVQQIKMEKTKTQLLLDRTLLQLEQKRTQLALLEEKKAEAELMLKKEKKNLLQSFIKLQQENKYLRQLHASAARLLRPHEENASASSQVDGNAHATDQNILTSQESLINQIKQAAAGSRRGQAFSMDENIPHEYALMEQFQTEYLADQAEASDDVQGENDGAPHANQVAIHSLHELLQRGHMFQRQEELEAVGQQQEHGPLDSQHAYLHHVHDDSEALQKNANRLQQLYHMVNATSDLPEQEQNTDPNINMDQLYDNMQNCRLDNYTQTSHFTSQNPRTETQQMSNNLTKELSQQLSQNLSSGIDPNLLKNFHLNKTNYINETNFSNSSFPDRQPNQGIMGVEQVMNGLGQTQGLSGQTKQFSSFQQYMKMDQILKAQNQNNATNIAPLAVNAPRAPQSVQPADLQPLPDSLQGDPRSGSTSIQGNKKFKIKILDSRTSGTRMNSQYQSASNNSSRSVINKFSRNNSRSGTNMQASAQIASAGLRTRDHLGQEQLRNSTNSQGRQPFHLKATQNQPAAAGKVRRQPQRGRSGDFGYPTAAR